MYLDLWDLAIGAGLLAFGIRQENKFSQLRDEAMETKFQLFLAMQELERVKKGT